MNKSLARGIRNNNPGNIRKTNDSWLGLSDVQDDPKFFQFKTMAYGIRAMACILLTYQQKYEIRTIRDIINRYAPEKENATANYVACVAAKTGFHQHDRLDMHDYQTLKKLLRAMVWFEVGATASKHVYESDLDKGILMAGIDRPVKPIYQSRTIGGTAIAGVSGIMLAIDALQHAIEQLSPAVGLFARLSPWFATILMLVGLGLIIYARLSDHKKGR